jgi:hypothetical protein
MHSFDSRVAVTLGFLLALATGAVRLCASRCPSPSVVLAFCVSVGTSREIAKPGGNRTRPIHSLASSD